MLVNPKYREINSFPCYPSVRDLPEPADVALVCLPAPLVPGVVEECGQIGIKNVVVFSSGFEETFWGKELAKRLGSVAEQFGINLLGPNSEGLWSVPSRAIMTFGSAADRSVIHEGVVTVISQSGSIGGGVIRNLQDRGVGCRFFVCTGNETNLTIIDFLEYVVEDGQSRVVLLFVEGLKDGWRFRDVASAARERGIQIVALKKGGSRLGRQATASHTGKMASSQKVYSDIFRQTGVIEVNTVSELVRAGEVLSLIPCLPALPGSSGVGVISISGGCRVLIADACEERRVPLAVFVSETEEKLKACIPTFGVYKNPVDPTGQILGSPEMFERTVEAIAADPGTEAILIQYANRGPHQVRENVDLLTRLAQETGKPLFLSFLGEEIDRQVERWLREARVLCAKDPDEAVQCLSWLYRRRENLSAPPSGKRTGSVSGGIRGQITAWENQVALLEACNIRVPRWAVVRDNEDINGIVGRLAFPMVAKALPEYCQHKTELGLVRLNLRDPQDLRAAVSELQRRVDGAPILIQEMVTGGVETLLAVREDPDFGPVLAIGLGGTLVELFDDVAYLSIPADSSEILQAVRSLKLYHLLSGFRGSAPADVGALLRAAERLSEAFQTLWPAVKEIELNPVFVMEEGRGVFAVDVLVR
jgi:acyl-CoA synthetase (NDP forming)